MTHVQLQTNVLEHYRKQAREQANQLRTVVDHLRVRITKKIGKNLDVVQAIRQIRQER